MPILDNKLRGEYEELFNTCVISEKWKSYIDKVVDQIMVGKPRYDGVSNQLNIPWYFIALVHNMECSLRFDRHLHNGDLLNQRTYHVPAGRPVKGNPPFTWEASAIDSLTFSKVHLIKDWTLPALLFLIEGYNGYGYLKYHPDVKSPYLWSFSNKYTKGKYASDGKWDSELVSKQCGTAVLLKRMQERNLVVLEEAEGMHNALVNTQPLNVNHPTSGKVKVDKLNIRADAGAAFEKVALPLIKGKDVEILEEKNGWYKVRTSIEGWVTKEYINT